MVEQSIVERVDAAIEAMLALREAPPAPADAGLAALVRIAAELQQVPREGFRESLGADLAKGGSMTSVTETAAPPKEGYHSIVPYLIVPGAAELIDFLSRAFGAREQGRVPREDGLIRHAEILIGDSAVELADATAEYSAMPAAIHLYVEDADAAYARALAAGGTSAYEPMDQPYGDREAGVKDPSGNSWYIATHKGERHIPEGLRVITPYLHARGADRLIEFLKRAFGAEEAERDLAPDGSVAHAKIRIGDSILEMGEAHGEWGPMPCAIHLYVDDADALYERALQAGATSLFPPADQPYGERSGGVRDAFGNHWYIATFTGPGPRSGEGS